MRPKQRICPLDGMPCSKNCPDRYPDDPAGGCVLCALYDAVRDINAQNNQPEKELKP